ncbi:hypothetical protein [Actinocorallia populi]|uniref:hypothetical protein n=1 Tax=Actinocorallia populi TaxID=2079200 RepID=UPI000D08DFC6|nr:hypothetical protein [Actinocorallia populi]
MTKAWLHTDQQLPPETELYRSDRCFRLWAYSVSHSRLLLRSNTLEEHGSTIDMLFTGMEAVKTRAAYNGLAIRSPGPEDIARFKDATPGIELRGRRLFLLESQGETDYVLANAVGWQEGVLGSTRMSFFAAIDPERPAWARHALGPGYEAGLALASAEELINALTATGTPARTERYRDVYVVMARMERDTKLGEPLIETYAAGAFLTRTDAEDLHARLQPRTAACWIEEVPIAI